MSELRKIIEAAGALNPAETALATIVDVEGSAYRHTGARMLISLSGDRVGSVSAGCLERDIYDRARDVISTRRPALITYDTRNSADDLLGYGAGCQGIIRILIESLTSESAWQSLVWIRNCLEERVAGTIMTVLEGDKSAAPGDRLFLRDGKMIDGSKTLSGLEASVLEAAGAVGERPEIFSVHGNHGPFLMLAERISPPVRLAILGAGDDAIPLASFATQLGWSVIVADSRAGLCSEDRFPGARTLIGTWESLCDRLELDNRTFFVVMTHNFLNDLLILNKLLPRRPVYLGILGPLSRTRRLKNLLEEDALSSWMMRVYGPAGLDIGAEGPTEIAIAIAAEIKAVLDRRSGGSLTRQSARDSLADPAEHTTESVWYNIVDSNPSKRLQ